MRKAFIKPELEIIKLSSVEDILASQELENNTSSVPSDEDYKDPWA